MSILDGCHDKDLYNRSITLSINGTGIRNNIIYLLYLLMTLFLTNL